MDTITFPIEQYFLFHWPFYCQSITEWHCQSQDSSLQAGSTGFFTGQGGLFLNTPILKMQYQSCVRNKKAKMWCPKTVCKTVSVVGMGKGTSGNGNELFRYFCYFFPLSFLPSPSKFQQDAWFSFIPSSLQPKPSIFYTVTRSHWCKTGTCSYWFTTSDWSSLGFSEVIHNKSSENAALSFQGREEATQY